MRSIHTYTIFIWLIIILKRISCFGLLFEPLVFSSKSALRRGVERSYSNDTADEIV